MSRPGGGPQVPCQSKTGWSWRPSRAASTVSPIRLKSAIREQGFNLRAVISEPFCVDVMNPQVNKWNGLKELLRRIGMEREDVVAVGDYDNDLEMILQSGIGVAVGNARECVKARADYVTVRDNEAGAVADMINELVLGRTSGLCLKNAV